MKYLLISPSLSFIYLFIYFFIFLLVTDVLHTLTYITYKIAFSTYIAKVTYNLMSRTRLTIYTLFTIYLTLISCRGLATIGGFLTY